MSCNDAAAIATNVTDADEHDVGSSTEKPNVKALIVFGLENLTQSFSYTSLNFIRNAHYEKKFPTAGQTKIRRIKGLYFREVCA